MKKLLAFVAAIAMVGSIVATASADVSLYGSVRMRTYFNSYDSDYFGGGAASSYQQTEWKMDGLTRLGFDFKFGDVTGKWEIDAATDNAGIDQKGSGAAGRGTMRLRLAYGVWNFGSGKLLIGQDYPLTDYYVTSIYQTDNGFQGWGGLGISEARISQIKLQFGGFRVAAITPYTKLDPLTAAGAAYGASVNSFVPKLEARYDGKIGKGFNWMAVAGFQTYDANAYGTGGDGDSKGITSWVLALAAKYNYKGLTIGALGKYAINGGNYGLCAGNPANAISTWGAGGQNAINAKRADLARIAGNGDVKDATTWSGLISIGYKFNEIFSAEAGYGYVDNRVWNYEDNGQAAYLQARFTVAPGVYVVPELIYYDAMESKTRRPGDATTTREDGSLTSFGIMWRIDFK